MKIVGIVAVALTAVVVLWGLGTALGVGDRLFGSDRMVNVYERFFDRCASVQALERQRDAIDAELATAADEDRKRRLQSSLQAVESQRSRTITQYNADADAPTRSFLRSEGLPGELDHEAEYTECAR